MKSIACIITVVGIFALIGCSAVKVSQTPDSAKLSQTSEEMERVLATMQGQPKEVTYETVEKIELALVEKIRQGEVGTRPVLSLPKPICTSCVINVVHDETDTYPLSSSILPISGPDEPFYIKSTADPDFAIYHFQGMIQISDTTVLVGEGKSPYEFTFAYIKGIGHVYLRGKGRVLVRGQNEIILGY
ncbi:MAG: hypothetical protein WA081_00645 [Desulfosalsimonadaceae bacterium]